MRKWFVGVVVVALAAMSGLGVALADSTAGGCRGTGYSRWPVRAWVATRGFLLPEDPRHQRGRLSGGSRALPERNRQGVSPQ